METPKFKVGDRVRLLPNHHGAATGFITGEVGTVIRVEQGGGIIATGFPHGHSSAYFTSSMLSLVKKPTIIIQLNE